MSHTTGPWEKAKCRECSSSIALRITESLEFKCAYFDCAACGALYSLNFTPGYCGQQSAAPELLAALKHTIVIFSTPSNGVWRVPSEPVLSETMAKIQAAIAKAEGRT